MTEARQLLHDRFNEALTLTDVAEDVNVHPVHLSREFKREFGWTVGDYVRRLRVDFVRRQLSTGAALADLALQAGFADQSHLTRVFKRLTGQTPHQLRAAGRAALLGRDGICTDEDKSRDIATFRFGHGGTTSCGAASESHCRSECLSVAN